MPVAARPILAWAKPIVGAGIIALLLWRVGTGPFLGGLRLVHGWALAIALGIGVLTTVCCAWRWSLIAGGLGVRLSLPAAIAHCYRAIFLNVALPGGILGDVQRAVRHGRDSGDLGRGIRAVVWDRAAGQVVQVVIALVVLLAFPSPVHRYLPIAIAVVAAAGLLTVLLAKALPDRGPGRWMRALRTAKADVRNGLLAHGNWLGVVAASAVVLLGNLGMFVVAAHIADTSAPLSRLVPLTLLALLAMIVPANIGGFGPREGVAAWAFGAAGMTAAEGVTAAVVYGALVLVSSLPGAAVLAARKIRRTPAEISAV
jgi:uncharacterized membrane protein YbhN (UPF0104 family)